MFWEFWDARTRARSPGISPPALGRPGPRLPSRGYCDQVSADGPLPDDAIPPLPAAPVSQVGEANQHGSRGCSPQHAGLLREESPMSRTGWTLQRGCASGWRTTDTEPYTISRRRPEAKKPPRRTLAASQSEIRSRYAEPEPAFGSVPTPPNSALRVGSSRYAFSTRSRSRSSVGRRYDTAFTSPP